MQKYIDITLENKNIWKKSLYHNFINNCSQQEFLSSQIPFYYAVESFPRMLLSLALKIPTSEERMLVIENIWEEHGEGDSSKFHTSTFKKHLTLLNNNKDIDLESNYFVENWISDILNGDYTISELASMLAGIEYMYAVISEDIAEYIDSLSLLEDSPHYTKHAKLDWSHGKELLDVLTVCGLSIDQDIFMKSQISFIEMFDKLSFPTEKELKEVSELPVAFFYSREDSQIGIHELEKIKEKNIDIFTVCSGGEHILNYLDNFDNLNIDAFDVNPNQIEVFKNKLQGIEEEAIGKFEYFFQYLRKLIHGYGEQKEIMDILGDRESLFRIVDMLFSRDNLNIVFTDNATKYSSSDFAEHFFQAFIESLYCENKNALNVFYNEDIYLTNAKNKEQLDKINYIVEDLSSYDFTKKYNFIDLSNIGDWIPEEQYKLVLNKAHKALNNNGVLITRKLLGDYDLKALLEDNKFSDIQKIKDYTCFYSECFVSYK